MRDRSIRKQADWNQFDTEFATNLILFIQIPAVKHVNNVNFNFIRFGKYIVNPLTPRSDCEFPPPAAPHFLVDKSQEFGAESRQQRLPDKLECSSYLFAGQCMDIVDRNYMLITSGS